jgi:hypothetical protein
VKNTNRLVKYSALQVVKNGVESCVWGEQAVGKGTCDKETDVTE